MSSYNSSHGSPHGSSLKSFLATAKQALAAPATQQSLPLTFVVGNESADIDSLCSALVLAFIRSQITPQRLHVPLSNLPREDLALRSELGPVLAKAGLDTSDLITLSDLPEQLEPNSTEWFLVDHNCLTGALTRYKSRIIGCIDHHVDEGAVSQHASPRVVESCGSCMSLIVDTYKEDWRRLANGDQQPPSAANGTNSVYSQLAQIALAPIIIDTINLTADFKIRPKDLTSAKLLKDEFLNDAATSFDQHTYYKAITAAKEDISHLSLRDVFRKDYKEWEDGGLKLGICCAVQNLDHLVQKAVAAGADSGPDGLLHELASWAEEQKLDLVSLMTTSGADGEFQRHLLVWAVKDSSGNALKRFVDDAEEKLALKRWNGGVLDGEGVRYAWRQLALDAGRKQVAPLLRHAMKGADANL